MEEADWDLHAVVRGCCSATSTSSTSAATSAGQILTTFEQDCSFSGGLFRDLFEPRRDHYLQSSIELDLHEIYKPFFLKSSQEPPLKKIALSPKSLPISPLSVLGNLQDPSPEQQMMKILPQQTHFQLKNQPFSVLNPPKATASHNPSPRSKKRKNSLKRVCHVPAESLSSDTWSWRKYGQKPIKGSPYPRGYYRCSTSKGCPARKQVERNRSDPGMFIVTYTAEHNHPMPTHRNSLAGSTRPKAAPAAETGGTPASEDPKKPSSSQEASPAAAPQESSREDVAEADDIDEDDGDFSPSNTALEDDFFVGLEDFTAWDGGDCFSGHFPESFRLPWPAATTAAGGG